MAACFGTGTIVDVFRQVGTVHFNRERLNIFVNTSPSSASQSLRMRPGMPSGPAAFRVLILRRVLSRLNDKCLVVCSRNLTDSSPGSFHPC